MDDGGKFVWIRGILFFKQELLIIYLLCLINLFPNELSPYFTRTRSTPPRLITVCFQNQGLFAVVRGRGQLVLHAINFLLFRVVCHICLHVVAVVFLLVLHDVHVKWLLILANNCFFAIFIYLILKYWLYLLVI